MNILFLCRLYYPHVGGVEKHVEKISGILSRKHQIKIITEKYDPSLKDYEKINGIEIYRMPPGNKRQIWAWMKRNKHLLGWANIIHAHDVFFWVFPYRIMHPKKKIFVTFHGWEGKYPISIKNKMVRKLSEWFAKGNICVGDFICKWYGTKSDLITYGAA